MGFWDELRKAAEVDQEVGRVGEIKDNISRPLPKALQRTIASAGSADGPDSGRRANRDRPVPKNGDLIPGQRPPRHSGGGTPGAPGSNPGGPKRSR